MASPVFKTAWAAVRSPEGSTPFLLRQYPLIQQVSSTCRVDQKRSIRWRKWLFANQLQTKPIGQEIPLQRISGQKVSQSENDCAIESRRSWSPASQWRVAGSF